MKAANANAAKKKENETITEGFEKIYRQTKLKYKDVWFDSEMIEYVTALFLESAVDSALKGNHFEACFIASISCFFEEHHATSLAKTQASLNWTWMYELIKTDERTLLKFLRKVSPAPAWMRSGRESNR